MLSCLDPCFLVVILAGILIFLFLIFLGRSTTPTPNKGSKTPTTGDRFIPLRSTTDFDLAHYKVRSPWFNINLLKQQNTVTTCLDPIEFGAIILNLKATKFFSIR